jgi:urease accessory protein
VLPVGERDPGSAAEVVVAAVADETGRTRYRTLRSSALLAVRPTIDGIHLLSATASPIGGDTIRVRLSVGPGAVVTVGSAAAAVARRGPDGSSSRQVVEARVARGGSLHWAPEPLVVAEGARHWSEVSVEVAAGGHLWWQETIVAGRTDEPSGWCHSRLRLDVGGWPALRHELTLGPGSGAESPAVLGSARAVATIVAVGRPARHLAAPRAARAGAATACVSPLAVRRSSLVEACAPHHRALVDVLGLVGAQPP